MVDIRPEPTDKTNIHATGLVYEGIGILIRGPAGAGKSLLTLTLLEWGNLTGKSAVLVGDDRLDISTHQNQLIMDVPTSIAGKIELRGFGILTRPYQRHARVDLLVDLLPDMERLPAQNHILGELLGIKVHRCPVPQSGLIDTAHQRLLVMEAIAFLKAT